MHNKGVLYYDISRWIPLGHSHDVNSKERDPEEIDRFHTHEYAELTYINSGKVLHKGSKKSQSFGPKTLLLVRPEHTHALTPKGSTTHIINIAFIPVILEQIAGKYFNGSVDFWAKSEEPRIIHLSDEQHVQFMNIFSALDGEPREMFYLEKFLLNFLSLVELTPTKATRDTTPDWLTDAVGKFRMKKNFANGLKWFYKYCNKTPNHVTRYCKKYYGVTPGKILQRARLEYAANLLLTTELSISEVAYESGYNDISHFYRDFKSTFNKTPAKFKV